ncbi:MAG: ATP-binding protein [Rhodoferax sp.]
MATRVPDIDATRCSGCGRCIAACQLGLFAFELQGWRKVSVLQDSDSCSGCGQCAVKCTLGVIAMQPRAVHGVDAVALQFLGDARKLCHVGYSV